MAYCYEFRKAVLDYMDRQEKVSFTEVGKVFGISTHTVLNWKKQGIESKLFNRKNNLKLDMDKLKRYVLDHPDMYQKEIAKEFKVWPSTICLALKRLGITRKKKTSGI